MKRGVFIVALALGSLSCRGYAQPLPVAVSSRTLTLQDAIGLAIQTNLTAKLAKAQSDEARGEAMQAVASLLPQITASAYQQRTFILNLAAQGFPTGGGIVPALIGPFNTFDARLKLQQNLINLNAWWKMRAGKARERAAAQQIQVATEQVAASAALSYVEARRSMRAVAAAAADDALAKSLLNLAEDQRRAGIATGIDVARASTTEAQSHLKLIRAQLTANQSDLALKRIVGIAFDTPLQLEDVETSSATVAPAVGDAIASAEKDRAEMQLARDQVEDDQWTLKAARAQRLPVLSAGANYGYSGNTPSSNVARTGSIQGGVDLPIFEGGAVNGVILEAKAHLDESQNRQLDTQAQVEEDVRLSLQTLATEGDEAGTADQALRLAKRELEMARDRYAAGIGDNIQLLSAEDALDRASDDQVVAAARLATARVNVASALGQARYFR